MNNLPPKCPKPLALLLAAALAPAAFAHPAHTDAQALPLASVWATGSTPHAATHATPHATPQTSDAESASAPHAAAFAHFAPFVSTHIDGQHLVVESDGLPHPPAAHAMMTGIRSWQQQVPLPQAYQGDNAWRIPLHPQLADTPISGKNNLMRGAIALAVNGVPIFNALNNRGEDTFEAGELDAFGGHCGRADDYHYHTAPLALQAVVGKDQPIAFALDGFAIHGLFNPAAAPGHDGACPLGSTTKLDVLNGHFGAAPTGAAAGTHGLYHYHASTSFPYVNGGLRGRATVRGGQVDPQPRTEPIRPAGRPLRGARITGFNTVGDQAWSLQYTLKGQTFTWNYKVAGDRYLFEFVEPNGTTRSEIFTARPAPRPRR